MKKNIIVVLAFLLIVFTALPVYANEKPSVSLVENNIINSDDAFDIDFDTDLTYYTFIYDHTNQWEVDDVIGQSECVDGYLYTKNFNTGVIRQLVNGPIESFYEKDNKVYFPYDNSIYCVDYLGLQLTEIYSSNKTISEKVIQVNGDNIYFVLDDKLVRYNETNRTLEYLFEASGMTDLYIKSENEYIYLVEKQMHYVCLNNNSYDEGCIELTSLNSNNGYDDIVIDDVQLMNSLFCELVENDESDASINSSTITYQKDYNLTSIMSDYPSGSYFTYDGGACYHHGSGCSYSGGCNCKYYDYAIQCMGFAKYASDRYAHKSSWNPPSTEQYEPNKHFNSANQIKTYFDRMTTGAYVLLSHNDDENGFHAMFYVKSDSNGITTYECNINGHCDVATYYTTYEGYKTRFNTCYGIYTVSHNYGSSATNYNSNFHKYSCTTCGGYILEYHYGSTLGNGTCMKCGYSGNIKYNYPMTMGDY